MSMRAWSWVALGLVGCGLSTNPGSPDITDTPGDPTGDSGTAIDTAPTGTVSPTGDTATMTKKPTEPVDGEAWCVATTNALRFDCGAKLPEASPAELELTAKGAPTRTFQSPSAVDHSITAWGLLPETEYTWTLAGNTGTVTTGALPGAFSSASISVSGTSFGFDAVLYPLSCAGQGYFTMIDGDGRIIWYEPNNVYFNGGMSGYEWSQESRSVLSTAGSSFLEQHVSGEDLLSVSVSESLHHDADRWGDYRYLLFERRVGNYNVDGIHVYEGSKLVDTWYMEDHFTVSGNGNGDWAHSNGLNVTEDGVIILSTLNFSTVVAIDGDPASSSFLEVLWHAAGATAGGLPGPDYVPVSGSTEGFSRQHNASVFGDDLWVFDNRGQSNSRAVRMAMDHDEGTLSVTGAWSFNTTCANQGGALPVEGGTLASCANAGLVWLFEDAASSPAWTFSATCGGGGGRGIPMTRAIPVFVQ